MLRPGGLLPLGEGFWERDPTAAELTAMEIPLLANPESPDAARIRARADAHRTAWLHGWRGVLGFAYLTLVAV